MRRNNGIAALVLAGGYSSRAQAFKPLLPLGKATIVEQVINNFRRADIHDITVVVGHRADELIPALAPLQVKYVYNAHYDEGMFSSVIAGSQSLRKETEAFFLLPVDMPLVKSHTVRLLYRAFNRTKADVIYPVFQGRRGHPPLIAAKCIPEIFAGEGTAGLRPILQRHEARACAVEVLDEGILLDADTPEDYRNIIEHYESRYVPSPAECEAIVDRLRVPERIIKHGRLVAEVAYKLAVRLNRAGLSLDLNLIIAAGKLHDLAREIPDHARLGARMLKKLGYPRVAKVVAMHHDIEYGRGLLPHEAAVVYLADKLVKNDRIVTINERFQDPMERYAANAEILAAVLQRRLTAQNIGEAIEQIAGVGLAEITSTACCEKSRRPTTDPCSRVL